MSDQRAPAPPTSEVVFLLDVDNTLLDNDRVTRDLHQYIERAFETTFADRYWAIFEALRVELGYADYLGALQRFRVEQPTATRLLHVSSFLVDYPFANRLYPESLDVVDRLSTWGPTVILSDGDVVFQPRKVERSGLRDAVDGRVLIYLHKEQMLHEAEALYPAKHYVIVDDKPWILGALKAHWGQRVTTVFPRQGHYANDPVQVAAYPTPDVTVSRIGKLVNYDLATLLITR